MIVAAGAGDAVVFMMVDGGFFGEWDEGHVVGDGKGSGFSGGGEGDGAAGERGEAIGATGRSWRGGIGGRGKRGEGKRFPRFVAHESTSRERS